MDRQLTTGSLRRAPAEPWMCLFVLADLVMFASFFHALMQLRLLDPALYAAGSNGLNQLGGTLNTCVLLTSSLLMALAGRALLDGQLAHGRALLGGTALLGWVFVAIKLAEYAGKYHNGIDPLHDGFHFYYYVLTGIHLAHVLLGLGLLGLLRGMALRPDFARHAGLAVGAIGLFWHLVDLLWIFLFTFFYLLP